MKFELDWWFPDHEKHLLEWLSSPKGKMILNDRHAYQGRKQLAALRFCRQFRSAVDVGAHVGLWAYNLAKAFQTVYAFEPLPDHIACFKKNVLDSTSNVVLFEQALGENPGYVTITTPTSSSGNSHVSDTRALEPGEMRSNPIRVGRLDDMLGTIWDVDLIKIDCEGYELNVLKGAVQTIDQFKPTVIVEQKRDMSQKYGLPRLGAVDFLVGMGYEQAEEISGDHIMVYHGD